MANEVLDFFLQKPAHRLPGLAEIWKEAKRVQPWWRFLNWSQHRWPPCASSLVSPFASPAFFSPATAASQSPKPLQSHSLQLPSLQRAPASSAPASSTPASSALASSATASIRSSSCSRGGAAGLASSSPCSSPCSSLVEGQTIGDLPGCCRLQGSRRRMSGHQPDRRRLQGSRHRMSGRLPDWLGSLIAERLAARQAVRRLQGSHRRMSDHPPDRLRLPHCWTSGRLPVSPATTSPDVWPSLAPGLSPAPGSSLPDVWPPGRSSGRPPDRLQHSHRWRSDRPSDWLQLPLLAGRQAVASSRALDNVWIHEIVVNKSQQDNQVLW